MIITMAVSSSSTLLSSSALPELTTLSPVTESSCFRSIIVVEHISLLPCYVGNLSKGITEHLNGKVLRYFPQLNGVLLTYTKPRLLQKEGRIFDEHPHIHTDLTYTACVFRPMLGAILRGTVNKVGIDHVGCLLYDCFNVSVVSKGKGWHENGFHTDFPSGYEEGSSIWFKIVSLEVMGSNLSLMGEYCDYSYAKHKGSKKKVARNKAKRS